MNIEIIEAGFNDKSLIRNMMQLYLYDFSEMDGSDLNEHGLYDYKYIDYYWVEKERFPFIIRVDGRLAGFVLVNDHVHSTKAKHSIAEFFIMRKYRRRGVGKSVAFQILDRFPSCWEVCQTRNNVAAQTFWHSTIGKYTAGDFDEYPNGIGEWEGSIQIFRSRNAT